MRYIVFGLLFSFSVKAVTFESTISGKFEATPGCSKKAMIWLSLDKENYSERMLLMHTEVPHGGTFRFFVKSGNYQVRGSDEAGCEFMKRITVRDRDVTVPVKLVKK